MTEVRRSESYVITDTDETIGRLLGIAEMMAPHVRDGFRRTDVGPGDKVVEVGCGPLGALRELSDLVGPQGTVVGVDMDEGSLRLARANLDRAGRDDVRLVHANINADAPDELRRLGPFDAAYCRYFLEHQHDPAETTQRIAALLRPGGHLVAHEFLFDGPLPRSEPPWRRSNRRSAGFGRRGRDAGRRQTWPANFTPSVDGPASEKWPSACSV